MVKRPANSSEMGRIFSSQLLRMYHPSTYSSILSHLLASTKKEALCLEDEAGADLVGGLVELLGVEGGAEAERDAGAEEDVVGDSGDATVVDLDLFHCVSRCADA